MFWGATSAKVSKAIIKCFTKSDEKKSALGVKNNKRIKLMEENYLDISCQTNLVALVLCLTA